MSTHSVIASDSMMKSLESLDPAAVDYRPDVEDPVISLTTLPSRLGTLKAVLFHLMRQSAGRIPIELHLARRSRDGAELWGEVPGWLSALRAVRLVMHADDPGPSLKYLPALSEGSRLVVVVDDDVLYPGDLVARLAAADAHTGGREAICMRGWRIHPALSWSRSVLSEPGSAVRTPVGILCGHGGYCVRASQLETAALADRVGAPEDCWMMDDVWISGHLSRAGTVKRLIPGSVRYKLPIEPALGGERERRNDVALAWFARDWREFELDGSGGQIDGADLG